MLNKEQFERIVKELKEEVNKMYWRFEAYDSYGELVVEMNQQLYKDLLEFRNTLPITYFTERLDCEGYDSSTDCSILTDGIFDCLINSNETYWNFYAIKWIDGCIPVRIVSDVNFDYRIKFTYQVTKNYNAAEKTRFKR